ncbi:MAG: DUF4446 family protein [Ruminococcus sp.]|nr:DUF4446 family protein [Ruminococcus sp.]
MNKFFDAIGIDLGILTMMLMILVLVLIVIVLNMSLGIHRLNRKYAMFMKGADGQSLERAFAQKMKNVDHLSEANDENNEQLYILKKHLDKTLTKYGIVKYDAFDDVGGKLSFALAMLDSKNTGFILNAIHSRDNCFFYIKEIVNGESYILLSSEETDALRKAVNFTETEL